LLIAVAQADFIDRKQSGHAGTLESQADGGNENVNVERAGRSS
jgi:hypothetical protein